MAVRCCVRTAINATPEPSQDRRSGPARAGCGLAAWLRWLESFAPMQGGVSVWLPTHCRQGRGPSVRIDRAPDSCFALLNARVVCASRRTSACRQLREPSSGRCGRVHSVLKREFGVLFDAPTPGAFGLRSRQRMLPATSHEVVRPLARGHALPPSVIGAHLGRSSHSQLAAAAIGARSCSPALRLIAPGETPMTRLKARLNAASDR